MWLEARKLTKPYQETVDTWTDGGGGGGGDDDDDDGNNHNKNDR